MQRVIDFTQKLTLHYNQYIIGEDSLINIGGYMKYLIALSAIITTLAFANTHLAPPNLKVDGKNLIFVDFKSVNVELTYDLKNETALAVSTITLEQPLDGHIIFDLIPQGLEITIDGMPTKSAITDMSGVSKVKYITSKSNAGTHTLIIKNTIDKNVSFQSGYVKSAFWMSDLSDRRYIEQYLPTNLEYDQYQMSMTLEVLESNTNQIVYTNGEIKELSHNKYQIDFRNVYTASSFYLHLTKKGLIPELNKTFKSIDGRQIPVTVYTEQSTTKFMNTALKVLKELEKDYGAFPHNKVVIYGAGQGGMEHCGATITSYGALGHELIHSYFARGVMPAHGNAGWVDEAVASWRDSSYSNTSGWFLSRSDMAAHSTYQRTTDRDAYSKGKRFLGYLNKTFTDEGKDSFKLFLRSFFEQRLFKPFKTPEFQKAIEDYYNVSLKEEFDKYIYGTKGLETIKSSKEINNPMHPKLTDKELFNLL